MKRLLKGAWPLYILYIALLYLALTAATPISYAGSPSRENDSFLKQDDAFTKFGRGVGNVLFGWAEIGRQIQIGWLEHGHTRGTVEGALRGSVWAVGRTVVGVYEVATFPFPGKENYGPILEPEFVLDEVGNR